MAKNKLNINELRNLVNKIINENDMFVRPKRLDIYSLLEDHLKNKGGEFAIVYQILTTSDGWKEYRNLTEEQYQEILNELREDHRKNHDVDIVRKEGSEIVLGF
jgi:hypothetical protein